MNCNDYLPLLSAHLDGANSEIEERRLKEHLNSCKHCRELLAQLEQADAALADSLAAPPPELTAKIMEQVRAEPKKKRSFRRVYQTFAVSALAVAALLALALLGKLPNNEDLPGVVVVEPSDSSTTDGEIEQEAPEASLSIPSHFGSGDVLDFSRTPEDEESTVDGSVELNKDPSETVIGYTNSESNEPVGDTVSEPTMTQPSEATQSSEPYIPSSATPDPSESVEPTSYSLPTYPSDNGGTSGNTYAVDGLPYFYLNRNIQTTSPALIVWGVKPSELEALKDAKPISFDVAPSDSESDTPTGTRRGETLFDRLISAMPLKEPLSSNSPLLPAVTLPKLTAYSLPYETLTELFDACRGTYELAVYYPATSEAPENCLVLIVETKAPQSAAKN